MQIYCLVRKIIAHEEKEITFIDIIGPDKVVFAQINCRMLR